MADLSLLQEDSQEEIDGFGVDDYNSESDVIIIPSALDFVSQDEMLTPLGRLDKYVASENIFNRQMVARSLLDTLKAVSEDERDCIAVLERVGRLADDSEPTVRAELMEQVPHIAIFCQENRPSIPFAFSKYLLPIVVRYLADQNNQVRKTSQAALLVLLEQELIDRGDIETQVCPVLVDLTAPDSNDDVKTEAMAIICKMAPMVGKDITERLFLPRFCEMCCDCRMFHVRKVCAANFGDICSVVGGEATEELLLPRFFQLCSDNVWGVRKACAECFMTVSAATSQEVRRTKLSSLFISLISDPSRWVRQAAFQSLGQFISTFASPSTVGQYFREEEEGDCSCTHPQNSNESPPNADAAVREPSPGLAAEGDSDGRAGSPPHTVEEGEAGAPHPNDVARESPLHCDAEPLQFRRTEEGSVDVAVEGGGEQAADDLAPEAPCDAEAEDTPPPGPAEPDPDPAPAPPLRDPEDGARDRDAPRGADPATTEKHTGPAEEEKPVAPSPSPSEPVSPGDAIPEQELYNSFHYWRTPIPSIDLDLELQERAGCGDPGSGSGQATAPTLGRKELEEMIENLEPHIDDPDVKAQVDVLTAALRATVLDSHLEDGSQEPQDAEGPRDNPFSVNNVPLIVDSADIECGESALQMSLGEDSELSYGSLSPEEERKSKQQDVVPQALLDQYLSMTDPSRAQTVDMEIAKHCAYSLPGVALTLGRQNWHCLRDTYETLASDMQWKVRRTLAFSIHELALILGDQLTAADLVPIFNSFLKDLDEVRIGVLKHLYDFLKLLHQETRRKYLYQLQEFLVTDNSRNWRFRSELAEQLVLLLELYSGQDVYDYLRPLAFSLCTDRVSSVRWISYKLVSEIIRKLSSNPALVADFMAELVDKFCHSPKWSGRQAFAFVCQLVIEDDCVSLEQFCEHLLAPLLQLASDPVPNVRVLLAKTIRQSLLEREYFLHSANSHQEALEQTLVALQMDLDKDVKYFASVHPGSTRISEDAMSTASSTY
ncbi:serine/threonine-protein phosphatase 4 regulatory subunit 1 isoform X1 [Megalops cyprinoides]|uniref:serine/threonine-protein phosphatase 4 regulatory subunit 1 isoform X1 n=1 Tax=Megalops cyprinoides TaxID=118141 RepID=UPI001864AC81|nr:serine/threonine-protein phosphatase 4 regulatory subunit 1 isoform X1 [Megalops cyprinoides]